MSQKESSKNISRRLRSWQNNQISYQITKLIEIKLKGTSSIHTAYNDDMVYTLLLEYSSTLDIYDADIMMEEATAEKGFDDRDIKSFRVIH